MILAVADYADSIDEPGKTVEPPPILRKAWQCQTWRALPDAGGIQDQEVALMTQMTIARNVYNTWRSWKGSRDWMAWFNANPEGREIVGQIMEMRKVAR